MKQTRIMVVDDDPVILRFVSASLQQHGFDVIVAEDGPAALKAMAEQSPEMIIMDIMMPGMNGDEVCRHIRESSQVPIIMLSAKSEVSSKVDLLDCGADDYITKPFGIGELMARVKALTRRQTRAGPENSKPFACGQLEVDLREEMVAVCGRYVQMSSTEYRLLKELVMNAGRAIPQQTLLTRIWGPEHADDMERLRITINRLREKLEPDTTENHQTIIAESKSGYCLQKTEITAG